MAIAAEIEGGKSFRTACEIMGQSPATVHRWRFQRPDDFGALIAIALAARGPGPQGRPAVYDDGIAERILDEIARGRAVHEICADPDMPGERTVMRWISENPEFAHAYDLARHAQAERLDAEALAVARTATPKSLATDRLLISTIQGRASRLSARHRAPTQSRPTVTRQVVSVVEATEALPAPDEKARS